MGKLSARSVARWPLFEGMAAGDCNSALVGYHRFQLPHEQIRSRFPHRNHLFFAPGLQAQGEDPSEVFLKAYMTAQQGEKLENENQFGPALTKFRFAGSLLEELRKKHGDWQPAIVEYRSRKISESILRVEGKLGTQKDLAVTAQPAPAPAAAQGVASPSDITSPPLPRAAGSAEPNVELVPSRPAEVRPPVAESRPAATPPPVAQIPVATPAPVNEAAIKEATRQLQTKVDELQAELQKSRTELNTAQKERESAAGRLAETNSKLETAQKELEKTRGAERVVRDELARAQGTLQKLEAAGKDESKAQAALRDEITQLKQALATAEASKSAAEKERLAAADKLTEAGKEVAAMKLERDAAIAQLQGSRDAVERVQVLITENSGLKQKLADAEKTMREIGEGAPEKEKELVEVKRQLEELRQQLAVSQKQNQDFELTVAELRSQLDTTAAELETARLKGASSEETARLVKENELLRGIVMRERQQEARREQAKKLMLAELDKLQVKSEVLDQQVELLASPITKLSDEELALLRQPVVTISDSNPVGVTASFAVAKNTTDLPAAPDPSGAAPAPAVPGPNVETSIPGVPADLVPVAREAKQNFDRGKFRNAERQYQEILAKAPNNLYALSNLGVVLFRTGKLKAAELTLKKAIALAPKDEFSHTTLGIVYYRQAKFDDALNALTRALAINPQSATAHNYLGITASQKGWQEAAEKEMLEAIKVNPDYADAHFNLAVIYATGDPPAKELAKQHYARATSLGAEADPSLEKLIR